MGSATDEQADARDLGLSPVNMWEMLALREIETRLSREEPELAAALSFGSAWHEVRRREKQVLAAAILALTGLFTLLFAFLWSRPHP